MSWPKHLKVDKSIVSLLSKATYENFPRAIRELVSNSYDADATKVSIKISEHSIVVQDNGNGMTPNQFDFYLRIAGKQHGKRLSPRFKRKRIGQFGVGFLAVFPFTRKMEITTTAKNSDVVLSALIPTSKFMLQEKHMEDIEDIRIMGTEVENPSQREEHYTIIKLTELSELAIKYFTSKPSQVSKNSIQSWEGIEKLRWELEETLPILFPPNSKSNKLLKYPEPLGMEVWLNNKQLFRHTPVGEQILETHQNDYKKIGDIKFKYVITNNNGPIHPVEARGLRIRVNNVGVGPREYFGLNVIGKTFRNLHWLSGEVHILEGLDEAIALNRDQITWNQDYEELCEFFRKRLSVHSDAIGNIRDSMRVIDAVIEYKPNVPVKARKELIADNIKALEKRGFKVEERELESAEAKPVEIDPVKKEITIFRSHPIFRDVVTINGQKENLIYTEWDYKTHNYPACRYSEGKDAIEINTSYPLFKSTKYGDIFKKIHILLLISKEQTHNRKEMYDFFNEWLLKDFEDLI